jgi:hypothetical protein
MDGFYDMACDELEGLCFYLDWEGIEGRVERDPGLLGWYNDAGESLLACYLAGYYIECEAEGSLRSEFRLSPDKRGHGLPEMLRLFVSRGGDLDLDMSYAPGVWATPMMTALGNGDYLMAKWLREHGASAFVPNVRRGRRVEGNRLLDYAIGSDWGRGRKGDERRALALLGQ